MEEQRLDKWLWCARLFKTRGLAGEAVKSGRVSVNGARAKPARMVRIGDQVDVRRPPYEYQLKVTGIAAQRASASRVGALYLESDQGRAQREALSLSIKASAIIEDRAGGKLTKKERRERDKLKRSI